MTFSDAFSSTLNAMSVRQRTKLMQELQPYQIQQMQQQLADMQLQSKVQRSQLAGFNDVAAGWGMTAGQLQARMSAVSPAVDLARGNAMNQQSKVVAAELAKADEDPLERIDHLMSGIMGLPDGSFLEMQRMNQAAANAQGAQQFAVQQQIDAVLDPLEEYARQTSGQPDMELFTNQDRKDGLLMLQDRLSKGASQEDALNTVLQAAARRAQSRFFELTSKPQGPQLPEGGLPQEAGGMFSSETGLPFVMGRMLGIKSAPGIQELARSGTSMNRSIEGLK